MLAQDRAEPVAVARRALRWFDLLCVPIVLAAGWSFVHALREPGNLSVSERSVEWLRGHHFGNTVSEAEGLYYSHHQPPTGGSLSALPKAVSNGTIAGTTTTGSPSTSTNATTTTHATTTTTTEPTGIVPLVSNPLPGEGVWQPLGDTVQGHTAMQVAYLRPDAIHGSVLAAVVRLDPTKVRFQLVPGLQEPGNFPWPAGAELGPSGYSHLLAAFNSAFRIGDSRGAFMLGGKVVGVTRTGAATVGVAADGTLRVGAWGRDLGPADGLVAYRQNLDLIVDGGRLVPGLDDNSGNRWGRTVGNALYVWRSGLGIDAKGRILYVASSGLTVKSLAALLQRAGAVRGMELDINYSWVSFNSFHHSASGLIQGTKLLQGMKKSRNRYLSIDSRDFFAVLSRT